MLFLVRYIFVRFCSKMRYSVKGKAVPVHAMKVQAGCRLKAPLILNLSTGCSASRIGRFTVGHQVAVRAPGLVWTIGPGGLK
jgi:hypothetical protein